jgi:hypothetical protein
MYMHKLRLWNTGNYTKDLPPPSPTFWQLLCPFILQQPQYQILKHRVAYCNYFSLHVTTLFIVIFCYIFRSSRNIIRRRILSLLIPSLLHTFVKTYYLKLTLNLNLNFLTLRFKKNQMMQIIMESSGIYCSQSFVFSLVDSSTAIGLRIKIFSGEFYVHISIHFNYIYNI